MLKSQNGEGFISHYPQISFLWSVKLKYTFNFPYTAFMKRSHLITQKIKILHVFVVCETVITAMTLIQIYITDMNNDMKN